MTLKNNRAPLLCCFQLCAWFYCHMWIQTGVRVRKRLSWVLTSVTLTFDLWPWPFAWTSLLTMVITPENFMMIRWWEHGEKGVTDRRTDGQTDGRTDRRTENTICRAAWSQLKMQSSVLCNYSVSSNHPMIIPSDEYHRTILMISQHWVRLWLGAIRQQAISWANIDTDFCHRIASLGHNDLNTMFERQMGKSGTQWFSKVNRDRIIPALACNKYRWKERKKVKVARRYFIKWKVFFC